MLEIERRRIDGCAIDDGLAKLGVGERRINHSILLVSKTLDPLHLLLIHLVDLLEDPLNVKDLCLV